uniref:Uncharacterized protein n=1 Tax=Utricularia reniformis TaxID=192314 RepID=A0A1Y0B055_9LAMI|nr:hypothetical protein AEK19_MT0502 [Utricularia reniformis]ART30758.1 hypothetical protein AEK19_MT0502 [Utricularia reniformis]
MPKEEFICLESAVGFAPIFHAFGAMVLPFFSVSFLKCGHYLPINIILSFVLKEARSFT